MVSLRLAVKVLCTVVLSFEASLALWNGTEAMLLMRDVHVFIYVPSDHCE
jgi:hypothetical protein